MLAIWVDLIIHSRLHARLLTSYQLVCCQVSVQCLPSGSTIVVCIVFGRKQWKDCCCVICRWEQYLVYTVYILQSMFYSMYYSIRYLLYNLAYCMCSPWSNRQNVYVGSKKNQELYSIQSFWMQSTASKHRKTYWTGHNYNHQSWELFALNWRKMHSIISFTAVSMLLFIDEGNQCELDTLTCPHYNSFYFNCPEQVVFWTPCKLRHQASGSGGILLDDWENCMLSELP